MKIEKKREDKRNEWKIHQKKVIEKMEIGEKRTFEDFGDEIIRKKRKSRWAWKQK